MRKVVVFQHIAHKILGTLDPILKLHRLNIRYVNFSRTPDEQPRLEKYNGLVVLGGNMGVYEADQYQHLRTELKLIEEALKKEIPVLGICLGSQLLAEVLGGRVRKHTQREVGWCSVHFNDLALADPLFSHFQKAERVFQVHGDTFDIPTSAVHLASSEVCPSQAFRYGNKAYGLQFHLEADLPMIQRWMKREESSLDIDFKTVEVETTQFLERSLEISQKTFSQFVNLFQLEERPLLLGSDHAKPLRGDKK
ncbi:MAG: type 1 glutamine amidotransferase [Bdellovibrio sp.]